MSLQSNRESVLTALLDLKSCIAGGYEPDHVGGICCEVAKHLVAQGVIHHTSAYYRIGEQVLLPLFIAWPNGTGGCFLPVPGFDDDGDYIGSLGHWTTDTRPGRLRLELLDYCIDELTKQVG